MWNTKKHSKKENKIYITSRASEWANYPIFVTESFMPILFYFIKQWWIVIIIAYVLNLLWLPFRYKFFNPKASEFAWKLNKVKWGIVLGIAIFFFVNNMLLAGILTLAWPFIALLLIMFSPPFDLEKIEENITEKISALQ
jgi:hypothetical protein